ncbi:MAG: CARDB domain-containing protein, partial [Candidatus Micrarchaeia archaeon]
MNGFVENYLSIGNAKEVAMLKAEARSLNMPDISNKINTKIKELFRKEYNKYSDDVINELAEKYISETDNLADEMRKIADEIINDETIVKNSPKFESLKENLKWSITNTNYRINYATYTAIGAIGVVTVVGGIASAQGQVAVVNDFSVSILAVRDIGQATDSNRSVEIIFNVKNNKNVAGEVDWRVLIDGVGVKDSGYVYFEDAGVKTISINITAPLSATRVRVTIDYNNNVYEDNEENNHAIFDLSPSDKQNKEGDGRTDNIPWQPNLKRDVAILMIYTRDTNIKDVESGVTKDRIVEVRFDVINNGEMRETAEWRVYVMGTNIENTGSVNLEAGEKRTITTKLICTAAALRVNAEVDYSNSIDEIREDNNRKTVDMASLTVKNK